MEKDNVEGHSSMWILKHARIALWHRIDVTMMSHCDFVTNSVTSHEATVTSQLLRNDVDMSYICHVTLWPVCESHCNQTVCHIVIKLCVTWWSDCELLCNQIMKHTVTRLWIRWSLWRLWCDTGNLASPESQPLEHQTWRSQAWVKTLSGRGLFFNSQRTGPGRT